MHASEEERLAYLYEQAPTRNELRTLLSIVVKMHTAMLNLAVVVADGADPDTVLNALRPVSEDHHRVMKFMREITNAGIDPERDA